MVRTWAISARPASSVLRATSRLATPPVSPAPPCDSCPSSSPTTLNWATRSPGCAGRGPGWARPSSRASSACTASGSESPVASPRRASSTPQPGRPPSAPIAATRVSMCSAESFATRTRSRVTGSAAMPPRVSTRRRRTEAASAMTKAASTTTGIVGSERAQPRSVRWATIAVNPEGAASEPTSRPNVVGCGTRAARAHAACSRSHGRSSSRASASPRSATGPATAASAWSAPIARTGSPPAIASIRGPATDGLSSDAVSARRPAARSARETSASPSSSSKADPKLTLGTLVLNIEIAMGQPWSRVWTSSCGANRATTRQGDPRRYL